MYQSRIQDKKKRSGRLQKKRVLELPDIDMGTQFGIVKDMLGNGRVNVLCENGDTRMARIRGSMRKSRGKTIIERNDLVMVADRDFGGMMDILYKYTGDEVAQMMKNGDIPEKIYKALTDCDLCKVEGTDDTIVFYDNRDETKDEQRAIHSDDSETDNDNDNGADDTDELNIDDI